MQQLFSSENVLFPVVQLKLMWYTYGGWCILKISEIIVDFDDLERMT